MNNFSECNPRAVLVVSEQEIYLTKGFRMIKNRNQVSKTSDNLAGLHLSPLKRHCSYNLNGSIIKKRRSTKSAFGYVAPYNADVAFKSSRNGEQTLGEKVPSVGLIDDPLNWTVNKVAESESAGGAR